MRIYNRKDIILRALIEHQDFINSDSLAQLIGVTSRTIRNDIKQLASELTAQEIELISIPGKGYKLPDRDHNKALIYYQQKKMESAVIPTLPDDRQMHILGKLIFTNAPLTYESLADELFVSRSTIENDLSELEHWLSHHHLQLQRKPSLGVQLIANETDLRYAMVQVLQMQNGNFSPHQPSLTQFLDESKIEKLSNILLETQKQHNLSLADDDFNYLLTYIAVSIFRITSQHELQLTEEPKTNIPRESAIAADISTHLKQANITELSSTEIQQLQITLQKIHLYDVNTHLPYEIQSERDETLFHLIKEKIDEISQAHSYDFASDTQLIYGLFFYLKSFLHHQYKTAANPDELEDIKKEYPGALEFAISISDCLNKNYQIILSESEIAQTALYFCAAIERIELEQKIRPLRVIIICASGIGASQLLAVKIRRYFPQLTIEDVLPRYRLHEAIAKSPDFIISTIPVETEPIPNIVIGHVLNDHDFAQIHAFMQRIHQSDRRNDYQFFTKLFREDLFFPNLTCQSQEEVISTLCQPLVNNGFVEPAFCKAVLAREQIFSTAIGNLVAIPHALSHECAGSQIAVGILNKPLRWGKDKVQIIFLLNLQYTSIDEINQLYEYFFDVIQSKNKIQKLLKAKSFTHFIALIQEV